MKKAKRPKIKVLKGEAARKAIRRLLGQCADKT